MKSPLLCRAYFILFSINVTGGVNNSVVGVCGDSSGGRIAATVSHELSSLVHLAVRISYCSLNIFEYAFEHYSIHPITTFQ